jgi:hypothetical protein
VTLYGYGTSTSAKTEAEMRRSSDFARTMGVRGIVASRKTTTSLLSKLVDEYDIKIAIHKPPRPAKYNRPETIFARSTEKIPASVPAPKRPLDRGNGDPREAFNSWKAGSSRPLKDRSDYGVGPGLRRPWGRAGKHPRPFGRADPQDFDGC